MMSGAIEALYIFDHEKYDHLRGLYVRKTDSQSLVIASWSMYTAQDQLLPALSFHSISPILCHDPP